MSDQSEPRYYGDGKHDDWPWLNAQLRNGAQVDRVRLYIGRAIDRGNPDYAGAAITNCVITPIGKLRQRITCDMELL